MRLVVALWLLLCSAAQAQVVEADKAVATDGWWGKSRVELWFSEPAPWRLFTLDDPQRLVLEVEGAELGGLGAVPEGWGSKRVVSLGRGTARPGWLRLELALAVPMEVQTAGLEVGEVGATLAIDLRKTSAEAFAAGAGAPDLPAPPPEPEEPPFVIVLDPGHGGIDPGADRDGVQEAPTMLALAKELAAGLRQDGFEVVLTREEDVFVSLEDRMTRARAAGAGVFLSLHADALELDQAAGASVYTLNPTGQSQAAQRMAERHERGDLLQGVDLSAQDDRVAGALMELAQGDTNARSGALQGVLVQAMADARARLNARPKRSARLAVLMATDFPSVLIEAGFLSNPADRRALSTADGRAALVRGLRAGLRAWAEADAAHRGLTLR